MTGAPDAGPGPGRAPPAGAAPAAGADPFAPIDAGGAVAAAEGAAPALQLEALAVSYAARGRELAVLRGVSLAVPQGEAYGLVGESGCGKSTVALAALGALPRGARMTAGRVLTLGAEPGRLAPAALRRLRARDVSLVYQDPGRALNPAMSVGRQLAEAYALLGHGRAECHRRSLAMLGRLRIADPARVLGSVPHQLSGGMQQRVVIAMALAKQPRLLVLDEPTTGLDATVEAEILDVLATLRRQLGAALLCISHDLSVIARLCDRVGVLYAGLLVEEGPTATVLADPRHPYTAGLLRCLPRAGRDKGQGALEAIAGLPPPPGPVPPGCLYAPRCPMVRERCRLEAPPPYAVGPGRTSRCHYHAELPLPALAAAAVQPGARVGAPLAGAPLAGASRPGLSGAVSSIGPATARAGPPDAASPADPPAAAASGSPGAPIPAGRPNCAIPTGSLGAPAAGPPATPPGPLAELPDAAQASVATGPPGAAADGGALLVADHVSRSHAIAGRPVRVLHDVSLRIAAGETLGLVGESGSGKSTLARVLLGLAAPDPGGQVRLAGTVLAPLARHRTPGQRRALQAVFQNPASALNRACSVARLLGRAVRLLGGLPRGAARRERVLALLHGVRLPEQVLPARPRQLSGGQRQRVAIAQALAGEPRLVLCDEPTASLDVSVAAAVLSLLAELQARRGVALLFISHDLGAVRFLSDRIAVLYLGRLMELGPAASVLDGPHHPYTEELVRAATGGHVRLSGEVPSPAAPPTGCVFHTRCPRKLGALCETTAPAWHEADPHPIRCHIPRAELATASPAPTGPD